MTKSVVNEQGNNARKAAVKAVKKSQRRADLPKIGEEYELSSGITVIFRRVGADLLREAAESVDAPIAPMYTHTDPKTGVSEERPNPYHPEYVKALKQYEQDRAQAGIEAMVVMGFDLVGDMPPADEWLPKIKYLAKRGKLDISGFNLEDKDDLEFLYKRSIVADAEVLGIISELAGVTAQGVNAKAKSFPGDAA